MSETLSRSAPYYLEYESTAFKVHEDTIDALRKECTALGLLSEENATVIFDETEEKIVCKRVGDNSTVAHLFYKQAKQLMNDDELLPRDAESLEITKKRDAIYGVVATHLSIAELMQCPDTFDGPQETIDYYKTSLVEIEKFCAEHGLAPLLPFIYDHATITSRLKTDFLRSADSDSKSAGLELYDGLAHLFSRLPNHLNALVLHMYFRDLLPEALNLLNKIAAETGLSLHNFLYKHLNIAETYVSIVYRMENFDEVIEFSKEIDSKKLSANPYILDKYIRSMIDTDSIADLYDFFRSYSGRFDGCEALERTISIATTRTADFLLDERRYEDGLSFLDRFHHYPKDRRGMPCSYALYLEFFNGIGDLKRMQSFVRNWKGPK
jgi:hypothetical protein